MKKNGKKKINGKIKKNLKNFLKDESGLMSKENVLKIGMGTMVTLSMFSSFAQAQETCAGTTWNPYGTAPGQYVHENDRVMKWSGAEVGPKEIFPSHGHHCIHQSY